MKKIISIIVCLALLLSTLTVSVLSVNAETLTSGDYEYSILADNTVKIKKYIGDEAEVTIPSSIDGKTVTIIGRFAFNENENLLNAVIPDSVKIIDDIAFTGCKALTNVTIPNGVTEIGYQTFKDCTSLSNIILPNSITNIGDEAFLNTEYYNNTKNWENDVLYIDNYLVAAKKSISGDYKVKEHTKLISSGVFENCVSLTGVVIPDSVIIIGGVAFSGCSSLQEVVIPDSVTSIGNAAFYYCSSLTNITIPNSVTNIDVGTFEHCTSLTSITIPYNVTSIGDYAFYGCSSLNNIYILNKDCKIYDLSDTINSCSVIYGYENSTAYSYAAKYNRTFKILNNPVIIDGQVNIYDNSTGNFELPEIKKNKGLIYFDGEKYYKAGDKISPDKGGNVKTVTYESEMEYGASARLNYNAGLRFYSKVDKDLINELKIMGFNIELGTLIAPKDLLDNEELSFDLKNDQYVDVKFDSNEYYTGDSGFEGVVGSLVNIKEENLTREFIGRGYIKATLDGITKIIYSDYCKGEVENNSRSVAFIANQIKNDSSSSDFYNNHKEQIDKWAELYKN